MRLRIEPLEPRTLLAGNVTAQIINGHLYITGDNAGNAIDITTEPLDAKALIVSPGDDDTTINGLTEPLFVGGGLTGHVIVRLNGGDDQFSVSKGDLPKDLRIDLGAGDDLAATSGMIVHRNLGVEAHDGDDRILINSTKVLRLTGASAGAGDDVVTLAGGDFRQHARILGGSEDDLIDGFDSTFHQGLTVIGGAGRDSVNPQGLNYTFDFRSGSRRGWNSGFADWRRVDRPDHLFIAEPRPLPAELNMPGRSGYFISGNNKTDDLFMFLRRTLSASEGVVANQTFMIAFIIEFASNAVTGGFGVGGSAGDSVFLKAGASPVAPATTADAEGIERLNLNHNQQGSGGADLSLVSTIANGLTPDDVPDLENPPYRSVRRVHVHPNPVTVGPDGRLHLVVGTDSGFEATTSLFYQRISVKLMPV